MNPPPAPPAREQRLLRNARRDGKLRLTVWAVALAWTVGGGYFPADRRHPAATGPAPGVPPAPAAPVRAAPAWVFLRLVLPGGVGVLCAGCFRFVSMADDAPARARDEAEPHP